MVCQFCKSEQEPIFCTVNADGVADVDPEDQDEDLSGSGIDVDTCFQLWLHVCRDCRKIIDGGIEDEGVLRDFLKRP